MARKRGPAGPYCPYCQGARREAEINPDFDIYSHVQMCAAGGRFIPQTICAEFRAWMVEIGGPTGKTAEQVYKLWHQYSEDCRNFDQSPVQFEFLEWYKGQLTPNDGNPAASDRVLHRIA